MQVKTEKKRRKQISLEAKMQEKQAQWEGHLCGSRIQAVKEEDIAAFAKEYEIYAEEMRK